MTRISLSNNYLIIQEGSLKKHSITPLWLRERLLGKNFVDQNNLQRLYEPSLLNDRLKITNFSLNKKKSILSISFDDGSKGNIDLKEILKEINDIDVIPKKKPWKNNSFKIPKHNYKEFKKSDVPMINMLKDFYTYGFVIIYNLPQIKGTVLKFAETIGQIRATNFGKHFNVLSKPKPNDLAYTSLALSAHTDNPYRKPVPGIQLLHCIANDSKGGDSTLVDGLAVSNYLLKYQKTYFDILTSTDVIFKFTDKDIILHNRGKLIELDENNKFKQIRFSGRLDFVPVLKKEKMKNFYKARKKIYHLFESNKFRINFRLDKGMLLMFDNHRLLHGRTKYDPNTGYRFLQGCYIEHDSTEGKLRRLIKDN